MPRLRNEDRTPGICANHRVKRMMYRHNGLALALFAVAMACAVGLATARSDSGAVVVTDTPGAATEVSASEHNVATEPIGGGGCCKALTAPCLACANGVTVREYCAGHPETIGCDRYRGDDGKAAADEPRVCCKAMLAHCQACFEGVDVSEYCARNPTTLDCPDVLANKWAGATAQAAAADGSIGGGGGGGGGGETGALTDSISISDDVGAALVDSNKAAWSGPEFVATSEWQTVGDGQPIPPGLHVQIDMQTGVKRARLLPEDERPGVLTMSERRDKKLKQMEEAIAATTANANDGGGQEGRGRDWPMVATDKDGEGSDDGSNSSVPPPPVRTRDELIADYLRNLKEVKSRGVAVREDVDAMVTLVDGVRSEADAYRAASSGEQQGSSDERLRTMLDDLTEYAHQIDNAIELDAMGGYEVLCALLSDNNVSSDVRAAAAGVVGAACSNNPKAQTAAREAGAIQRLATQLQSAVAGGRVDEARRTVHAVTAVVRFDPQAATELHAAGGFAALHDTLASDSMNSAVKAKAAHLVAHLADEADGNDGDDASVWVVGASGRKQDGEEVDASPPTGEDATTSNSLTVLPAMQRLVDARLCDHASGLLDKAEWAAGDGRNLGEAALGMARELLPTCHASHGGEWTTALARTVRGAEQALDKAALVDPEDEYVAQLRDSARALANRLSSHADTAKHDGSEL